MNLYTLVPVSQRSKEHFFKGHREHNVFFSERTTPAHQMTVCNYKGGEHVQKPRRFLPVWRPLNCEWDTYFRFAQLQRASVH